MFVASVLIMIIPFIAFFILKPQESKNIIYGTTFSDKYAEEIGLDWQKTYIAMLDDLGFKNLRLVVYWDEVEKKRDVYDYSRIKWQLREAQKRNVNVILVVGRKVPRWPECFEPNWWKRIESDELKQIELFEYVKNTVDELRGYDAISIWQVENEPLFSFGKCGAMEIARKDVLEEIAIVRNTDGRPILSQDSGEGGLWYPTYKMGDYLGISMYRRIWFDFWGIFLGRSFYFQYPLSYWTYKVKANVLHIPMDRIIVTELQAEPWGPVTNSLLTQKQKDKTMSKTMFLSTFNYAQKTGFDKLYLWGVEWWYWEKTQNDNPYFWNTVKAIIN